MERKKTKVPFRITAWLLIAVMVADNLLAGVWQGQSPLSALMARASETEKDALFIPAGGDVEGYDPEKNGYYAYLNVSYMEPGSEDAENYTSAYLPVLCYDDCIYVKPNFLQSITDLSFVVNGDKITFTSGNKIKRVHMTVGKTECICEEGYTASHIVPLRALRANFSKGPVKVEESIYVPLNSTLCLFGLSPIISDDTYRIEPHYEDAIDVLLRLYSTADHGRGIAGFEMLPNPVLDNQEVKKNAMLDHIFGICTFSVDAYEMALPSIGVDRVDLLYCEQIFKDMLSTDEEQRKAMDEKSLKICKQFMSSGTFIEEKILGSSSKKVLGFSMDTLDLVLDDLGKLSALESEAAKYGVKYIPGTSYKALKKKYSAWKKCGNKINAVGLSAGVLISLYNNAVVYTNRDTAAAVGMKVLLSNEGDGKNPGSRSVFTTEEYRCMVNEFKNFVPDAWVNEVVSGGESSSVPGENETGKTVLLQSVDDVAMTVAEFMIGVVAGGLSAASFALSTIETIADAMDKSPVSQANALVKAYYGQSLLNKIGGKLYKLEIEKLKNGEGTDKDYQELIALSYLYLRLAKLECDYLTKANYNDPGDKINYTKKSQEFAEMMAILLTGCPRAAQDEAVFLPATAEERIKDARESLSVSIPEDALVPLYMKVSGTVLEKSEGEPPVPDAVCAFTATDNNTGRFGVDSQGRFSVYLALEEPTKVETDLHFLEKTDIRMRFSSEEVKGEAERKVGFEPKGDENLGIVYLSDFNWYVYIRDHIEPEMGWASLETAQKDVIERQIPYGWDYRSGLLSAQITDFDDDGSEDCLLYYLDNNYVSIPGGTVMGDSDPKSTIYVKLLTKDAEGVVSETEARQIVYGDGSEFSDAVGGILESDGKKYVYFECNSNAYFANGYGTLYTFYSYDGTQLRPDYAVGKTGGGSIEFEYSKVSYDESGKYTGSNVIYDGSPWYNADGTYSKQLLCVDRDWKYAHPGESALMDYYDPTQAMITGLSGITGIDPGEVVLDYSESYDFSDRFVSYRDMDCFSEAFHYNSSGPRIGRSFSRSMTVTVEDYTDLKEHVEEVSP